MVSSYFNFNGRSALTFARGQSRGMDTEKAQTCHILGQAYHSLYTFMEKSALCAASIVYSYCSLNLFSRW